MEQKIKQAIIEALSQIGYLQEADIKELLQKALEKETSDTAKDILATLLENNKIASNKVFPLCQDTGLAVFFVSIGRELDIQGVDFDKVINQAVAEAYQQNGYRCSAVRDPINRVNTQNNTPAIIHNDFIEGDGLEIGIMLKGGGAENMSAVKMLSPADGIEDIRDFVCETVTKAGGNACPPLFVGVGIGGNFELAPLLAKKSLLRPITDSHSVDFWQKEEIFLLDMINKTGVGPMGLGGDTTALKVCIETAPCHIASLPVAVNLECHAHRVIVLKIK